MSFEPKIFRSDESPQHGVSPERRALGEPAAPLWDDAAQLELPDDLALLAEQLRDDAQHLAARHPADATPEQRAAAWAATVADAKQSAATQPRVTRVRWWASGAAAAAVVVGASWLSWSLLERESARPANVAVVSPSSDASVNASAERLARMQPIRPEHSPEAEMKVIMGSEEIPGPRVIRLPEDSPPRVVPVGAFLQDVSGPELDAMLELLVEQTDGGLSI